MSSTAGPLRFFPYEEPYEHQRDAIERIGNALARGQDVLFEGACGTGKTLSALVPALDHARTADKTVVITTNVHQQMRQFVRDARVITQTEPIRAVVFRGKSSMCHIDVGYQECQALRDTTQELIELEHDIADLEARERELRRAMDAGEAGAADGRSAVLEELQTLEAERQDLGDRPTCTHYERNLTGQVDPFFSWLFEDVRYPDEIFVKAEEAGMCGYELLKDGIEGVDLVVCNYAHLLHPSIREQFFRWLGRDPSDVIVVFDEAHNVESAARDHASRSLAVQTFDAALDELLEVEDPRAEASRDVIAAFRRALVDLAADAVTGDPPRVDGTPVGEDWVDVSITREDGPDRLTRAFFDAYAGDAVHGALEAATALGASLDQEYERRYKAGETATRSECQTLHAAAFIDDWLGLSSDPEYYPVISVRRHDTSGEVYGRAELYACIPREVAGQLFESVYASVLMSATLRPFSVIRDVLAIDDPVELAFGLSFPASHRRTFVVDGPALFARERNDPKTQSAVEEVLAEAIRMTPGNTLIYFPSYAEAERYHDRLEWIDATRYLDRPATRAESLRETFTASNQGAMFTSIWGTLTEGVSFDGDDARSVIVVGVPYPYLDDRMDAVRDAYDDAFGEQQFDAGWRYAVEIPTIRKTRQALGRVLRSPDDYGVRILLDRRYTADATIQMGKYAVRETFPPEERDEFIDVDPDRLGYAMGNFYGGLDAYDGQPPML